MTWIRSSACHSSTCCVEVSFRKSSFSGNNGQCVEVAQHCDEVLVRDSKDPDGPVLRFDRGEWVAFLGGVRGGEFDVADLT